MRQASGHGRRTAGIALQLAAMAMLLCAPYLPLLAHGASIHAQPGRCAMDHRLCGCSPVRIASHTCCCFRNMKQAEASAKHGCCPLQGHGAPRQTDLDSDSDDISSIFPKLSSLPCGLDHQVISHAASELKYLLAARAPLPTQMSASHNPSPSGDNYLNPSPEPPVPPPKIIFFS